MTYYLCTGLVCLFLLFSAFSYLASQNTIEGIRKLGLPDYLRLQLAVMKFIAVVVLLMPGIPLMFKDWAYAGVFFFLVTAINAHASHGDPWILNAINAVLIALLLTSRYLLIG